MVNGAKERGCRSGCRWDRVGQAEQPTAYTAHRMIHTRVIYCVQRVPPWAGDRLETCSLLTCLITYLHSDLGHGSGGGGLFYCVLCMAVSYGTEKIWTDSLANGRDEMHRRAPFSSFTHTLSRAPSFPPSSIPIPLLARCVFSVS